MEHEKMIEEMKSDKEVAKELCRYFIKTTDADRFYCPHCSEENIPCSFATGIVKVVKESLIPEGAVVLTREGCDSKIILDEDHFRRVLDNERKQACKETALKIRNYIKQHTELGDYYAGECYDELDIWSFDRFLKENFGVEVEE